MVPFILKEAVAATPREGAKTQRFRLQGGFTRGVSDSSPSFPSHLPALCVLASWRPRSAVHPPQYCYGGRVLLRRTGLCVNCLSWVRAVRCRLCRGVWVWSAGSQCIKVSGNGGYRRFHAFRRSRVVGPSRCWNLSLPNGEYPVPPELPIMNIPQAGWLGDGRLAPLSAARQSGSRSQARRRYAGVELEKPPTTPPSGNCRAAPKPACPSRPEDQRGT